MLINKTQLSPLSGFQSPYGKKTINLSSYKSAHYLIFASFRLKINFSCFQSQVHRQLTMSRIFQLGIFRSKQPAKKIHRYNLLIKNFSQRTTDRSAIGGNWLVLILSCCHTQIHPTGVHLFLRSVRISFSSFPCVVVVRRDYI